MVEKLLDWLKSLPGKFVAWWNKLSKNQKTGTIFAAVGIAVAFAVLITLVTRIQYTPLVTCENTKQASEVKELLDSNDIQYRVSDSGLVFEVNKKQLSTANLLLGSNSILSDSYASLDSVVNGSLSTTESDKEKLFVAYKESQLETDIKSMSFVESASVQLNIPENDGTLIASKQEASAMVMLKLNGPCTPENAATIANAVKTAVGNETTENVVIFDTDGNLLYSGGNEISAAGFASSQLSLKQEAEAIVKNEVRNLLLGTNEFDLIEVATNLELDFSNTEQETTIYTPADGQNQGVLSHESNYDAETQGGVGLVPGTDSNTENNGTYVYQNGDGSSSTVSQNERDYLPNKDVTIKQIPAGTILYDQSSIAVTAIRYNVIKQEDAKKQGLLDDMTWDEFKLANQGRTKLEVDEDLRSAIAHASGISAERITLVAYEEPFFVDKEKIKFDFTGFLQIALIAVILLLLAIIVLRSFGKDKKAVDEEPEELSVEGLLQTIPVDTVEDIELETKSETRKMIDKFVDENPEAVANLLRNWLNEDWG